MAHKKSHHGRHHLTHAEEVRGGHDSHHGHRKHHGHAKHPSEHEGAEMHPHHLMHHLAEEHKRHGHRMHHEAEMHSRMGRGHAHGQYENEEDRPKTPPAGHLEHSMGVSDYKREAHGIAYGAAGEKGCRADGTKIVSQFKDYHWEGASGSAY